MNARPASIRLWWIVGGVAFVLLTAALGLVIGPTSIDRSGVLIAAFDAALPGSFETELSDQQVSIVQSLRLPRVVLGLLVGASLSISGATFQGVFRNPLADPYLLGVAAGGGLGATIGFAYGLGDGIGQFDLVQVLAFAGALAAVFLAWMLGNAASSGAAGSGILTNTSRSATSLVLAGVAIAAFFTAIQTFLQQQNTEDIRQVYSWLLGGLNTSGWTEVTLLLPVAIICVVILLSTGRVLDVLAVGDEEASMLGMSVTRTRLGLIVIASLLTASAVAVSGLIAFVGLIIPHTVRLIFGSSYRIIIPMSVLVGAGFLVLSDLIARTALSPTELPIGVVTAFLGAPFFVVILRTAVSK